jgi:hypothetical protein
VTDPARAPLLTLEPLIDAVREGVEAAGWELSGLQKTTSHQFEGRWEGDSSRSAYLFFHPPEGPDWVSVDVFLDETTRGLAGNVALVVDLEPLGVLGDVPDMLRVLGGLSTEFLPPGYRTPVTLRFRLDDGAQEPGEADAEARFKLRLPKSVLEAGASAVAALASSTVRSLEELMNSAELSAYLDARDEGRS